MPDDHFELDRRDFVKNAGAVGGLGLFGLDDVVADADSDPQYGPRTQARVRRDVGKPTATREFRVFHEEGEGTRTWRTVKNTGNCCENYLAASPAADGDAGDDRLFDMGGDYLRVSDDYGRTWDEVQPPMPYPVLTSEGCVTAAPNGDVVAIDWDPYSGDRVIAYKYVNEEDQWYYTEVPLKSPFYDRPWLAVFPGPFEVAGETVPYISVMRGGYPVDSELYLSLDGLNYFVASTRFVDTLVQGSVERYLTGAGVDSDGLDWVQPHTQGGFVPLGDGQALAGGTALKGSALFAEVGADHVILNPDDGTGPASDLQWAGFDTPEGLQDAATQVDAKGHIHQVEFETDTEFVHRVSTDGGDTWTRHGFALPDRYRLSDPLLFDFKVKTTTSLEGNHDLLALAVHGTRSRDAGEEDGEAPDPVHEVGELAEKAVEEVGGPGAPEGDDPADSPDDQDVLYKMYDPAGDDPEVEIHYVGDDDLSYVSGVSTEQRFDFSTLAIFADGRVAMSFADAADSNPMVAIEAPDADPEYFFRVSGSRSDDGDVHTAGDTTSMTVEVTPQWTPEPESDFSARFRDVLPPEYEVLRDDGGDPLGDATEVVTVEEDGTVVEKRVSFPEVADREQASYEYFVRVAESTGQYALGPAEIERVDTGEWVGVSGTGDTHRVVGADDEV